MFYCYFGFNVYVSGCGDYWNGFVVNGDQFFVLNFFLVYCFFMQLIVWMVVQGDFCCEQCLFVDFWFQWLFWVDIKIGFF